ncbi:MAG: cell division protein FtsQ/DivIB [Sphingomonadales bacterium]
MNIKRTIQRILFFAFWIGVGTGMIMLLAAAIRGRNKERLRSYTIEIKAGPGGAFLKEQDVALLLQRSTAGVKGELLALFNLRQVEQKIKSHIWIRDVQLYFDNQDILHVQVQEKVPLARLFTSSGASRYLDEQGDVMPLSLDKTIKVPVFTGLSDSVLSKKSDSFLLQQVFTMAQLLARDSFWTSQVAQIDYTPAQQWELIPVVGDHIVKLGSLTDIEAKLRRLLIFYQQVLSKTGLSRYRMIDVRFAGQVVAGSMSGARVDSLQLRRSVEKLLRDATEAENDTMVRILPKPLQPLLPDEPNPSLDELKKVLPGAAPIDTNQSIQYKQKKSTNNN